MYLRCHGKINQHALLLDLEQQQQDCDVYYVAPAFCHREDLSDAYRDGEVWDRSFQVKPSEIGALSAKKHHVSFQKPGGWQPYSEEPHAKHETSDSKEILRKIERQYFERKRSPLRDQLSEIDAKMFHILPTRKVEPRLVESLSEDPRSRGKLTPLRRAAYLARSILDCQLFAVTERQ